jgi:AcrR family transcriptional regulator
MISQDDKIKYESDRGVKGRLLDAAEILFCEHGFEGTSIRDIAASADCNIAAVNYYFGGKENLYMDVWRRHLIPMRDDRIASIEKVMSKKKGKIKLEDLLKSFADTFVGPLMNADRGSCLSRLMAREYIDRRLPTNIFVDEVMTPTISAMSGALIKTCPHLDKSKVLMVIFSLVGQLVHLVHIKVMFEQSDEDMDLPAFDLNEAINHIVKFTGAGIRAYCKGPKQ